MSEMIFANKMQIELWSLTEIFEGMIAYDFIKITCCQKLQKVDLGRVNKQGLATDQAQYCPLSPLFENWRADLCALQVGISV